MSEETADKWSVEQVAESICGIGAAYEKYRQTIIDNGVDGVTLLQLTSDDLVELGVVSGLHQKRIINTITQLKKEQEKEVVVDTSNYDGIQDPPDVLQQDVPSPVQPQSAPSAPEASPQQNVPRKKEIYKTDFEFAAGDDDQEYSASSRSEYAEYKADREEFERSETDYYADYLQVDDDVDGGKLEVFNEKEDTVLAPQLSINLTPHLMLYEEFGDSEIIGEGHFGMAIKATWNGLEAVVKIPKNKFGKSEMSEMKTLMTLKASANVIAIIGICDAFLVPKTKDHYVKGMVLPYLKHGDLKSLVKRKDVLEPSVYEAISLGMARGIQQLHAQNIVHRDIALRNFLLSSETGRVVVCDFGLSREVEEDDSYYSDSQFPWRWCSPETLIRKKSNKQTDIWMLGLSIWELYNNSDPFPEIKTVGELIVAIQSNVVPIIFPKACPDNIKTLIANCCRKDAKERLTIDEVVSALLGQSRVSHYDFASDIESQTVSTQQCFWPTGRDPSVCLVPIDTNEVIEDYASSIWVQWQRQYLDLCPAVVAAETSIGNVVSVAMTVFNIRTGAMHTPLPGNTASIYDKRRAPDVTAYYSKGAIYVILVSGHYVSEHSNHAMFWDAYKIEPISITLADKFRMTHIGGQQYDTGSHWSIDSVVSQSGRLFLIDIHNGGGNNNLYYRVAEIHTKLKAGTDELVLGLIWLTGEGGVKYTTGDKPAVAILEMVKGQFHILECHNGGRWPSSNKLYFRTGILQEGGKEIGWTKKRSTVYSPGDQVAICGLSDGRFMEVHKNKQELFWRLGSVQINGGVEFDKHFEKYDDGYRPSVSCLETDMGVNFLVVNDGGDVHHGVYSSGNILESWKGINMLKTFCKQDGDE